MEVEGNCSELEDHSCVLETKDLWEKFHEFGTEMIVTKSGSATCSTDSSLSASGCPLALGYNRPLQPLSLLLRRVARFHAS
ncbi:hypothetical protein HAZT_HAZT003292 [Hyalella azteca]|uniref:T-box domain-containing protein n=1 Tax=Hyalella azteca TaxID=294128 RepID=A0A6A0H5M3_HYAAZ|nr:hypothetical protein HAZT_HAZT003292 [Hyalella azteca]